MSPQEWMPPEVGIPLSAVLWLIWWVMGSADRRERRKISKETK